MYKKAASFISITPSNLPRELSSHTILHYGLWMTKCSITLTPSLCRVCVQPFDGLGQSSGNFWMPYTHVSFLVKGHILITSDWQLWSHLARWSLCPGVETNCTAMAGVLLWLSLSFNRYLAPADTRWKVPKATVNYVYFSAPAVYTTRHREPFPAKTPLAAAYCGNISWTANRMVMVWRQTTYLTLFLSLNTRCSWNFFFCYLVLKKDRWYIFFNEQSKYKISCQPKATRAQTATSIIADTSELALLCHIPYFIPESN